MKTFLSGVLAVASVRFPLSQKAEAHGYATVLGHRPYYGGFGPNGPDPEPFSGDDFAGGGFRDWNYYGRRFDVRHFGAAGEDRIGVTGCRRGGVEEPWGSRVPPRQ